MGGNPLEPALAAGSIDLRKKKNFWGHLFSADT